MKSTIEYMQEAKESLGITSDYALAKWMGVTKQAIGKYQAGDRAMDDYAAVKIAEALKINAMEVIAAANAEREKDSQKREFWEKLAKTSMAAGLMMSLQVKDVEASKTEEIKPLELTSYTLCAIALYGRIKALWLHYWEVWRDETEKQRLLQASEEAFFIGEGCCATV